MNKNEMNSKLGYLAKNRSKRTTRRYCHEMAIAHSCVFSTSYTIYLYTYHFAQRLSSSHREKQAISCSMSFFTRHFRAFWEKFHPEVYRFLGLSCRLSIQKAVTVAGSLCSTSERDVLHLPRRGYAQTI